MEFGTAHMIHQDVQIQYHMDHTFLLMEDADIRHQLLNGTVLLIIQTINFQMNNILQAQIKRAMFVEVIIQYVNIITLELILPPHLRQPALLAVLAKTTALQH